MAPLATLQVLSCTPGSPSSALPYLCHVYCKPCKIKAVNMTVRCPLPARVRSSRVAQHTRIIRAAYAQRRGSIVKEKHRKVSKLYNLCKNDVIYSVVQKKLSKRDRFTGADCGGAAPYKAARRASARHCDTGHPRARRLHDNTAARQRGSMAPRRAPRLFCFTSVAISILIFACSASCAADALDELPFPSPSHSSRTPRSAALNFLQLISGYDVVADDDWPLSSLFPAAPAASAASAGRRRGGRVSSLPVLLLPVALHDTRHFDAYSGRPARRPASEYDTEEDNERPSRLGPAPRRPPSADDSEDSAPRRGPTPRRPPNADDDEDPDDEDSAPRRDPASRRRPAGRAPFRAPPYTADSAFPAFRDKPNVTPIESSQRLVEMFRAQTPPPDAQWPPAIVQSEFDASERVLLTDDDDHDADEWPRHALVRRAAPTPARAPPAPARAPPPPARPRLKRALKIRAVLMVPRAGFSEAYTVWWDPSGDSRMHFQDGSAATFRKLLPNGLVQKVEMHVDRTGGRVLRRCATSVAAAGAAERAHPALPDLQLFTFAGYEEGEERWLYRAEGAAGGARGEALTALHELRLLRDGEDSALPLRYSVAVNSSVLGADCDGYHHHYLDVYYHDKEPEFFEANLDELCDVVQRLNASEPDALARLEPLREFTLPRRDPRYDAVIERFKEQNSRQYVDDAEEAVRKNAVLQGSRFVASGNRAGATFQLDVNFLGDRLDAELRGLRGAARGGTGQRAERFPHGRRALGSLAPRLPAAFDWRAEGGVSPVRFQGMSCASCWAFATVGAVEGALFRRSGRLTPLSEQQLVDCAHPFGGNGCAGTWPSRAYDYVRARGLAALDDYSPYKEKVTSQILT
ncbi:uncharacterized protein [Maniola hyperantus]|uniref:uncharacterized protein n=1 Tax=Aphantopus hyperantus TaxID=2795564 RepID=UPI003749CACC